MRCTTSSETSLVIIRVPMVWRNWCAVTRTGRPAGVADVAVGQPAAQAVVQRAPQKRPVTVRILAQRGQQKRWRSGEALAQVLLLAADLRQHAVGDRDDRLARELVVIEAQVRGAGLVGGDRIKRQAQAVDRPQSGLDQDHDGGAGRKVRQAVKRLVALELAHHELIDEPRQPAGLVRDLAAVVRRVCGQPGRPLVQAHVIEKDLQVGQKPAAPRRRHGQVWTCAR